MECYSRDLAARLEAIIDDKLEASTPLSLDDLRRRPLWMQLRDGVAWLAQPYL